LVAAAGAFAISGSAAIFQIKEPASAGSYNFAGVAATFTRDFVNWFPLAGPSGGWTVEPKPSPSWTAVTPPSAIWTPDNAQFIPAPVTV
jgi:hypothetical protein